MKAIASAPKQFDLADSIALICSFREEKYAFERLMALLTFGLWVIEPNDATFVNHGRIVGAAQIVKSLLKTPMAITKFQADFLSQEFSSASVAATLISPRVIGPFEEEIEPRKYDLELVASIAETFLSAPESKLATKRPSLNKAIYFIANNGFGSGYRFSPATVKKRWTSFAVTAAFYLAAEDLEIGIIGLAPDLPDWRKKSEKLLKNQGSLQKYFGSAKSIQDQFVRKLDNVSRRRFRFVEFPAALKQVAVEFEPFEGEQLRIYKSYAAPKISK